MAADYLASKGYHVDEAVSAFLSRPSNHDGKPTRASTKIQKILGARLPKRSGLWDVGITGDTIQSIEPYDSSSERIQNVQGVINANGGLLCPSLCHAHIHLDKCFLLHDPKYDDLQLEKGDFAEAMSLTNQAKTRFDEEDLLRRGGRLIRQSVEAGVTAMRAFVEVDEIVRLKCVNAAVILKRDWEHACHVQICAFAQLPLFSERDDLASGRRALMQEVLDLDEVEVVGSAPYVEKNDEDIHKNMEWTVEESAKRGKYLDFHLDYHLHPEKAPTIWSLIDILKRNDSKSRSPICIGHGTRLSMLDEANWHALVHALMGMPITFVGLPASDLFMMGGRGILPVLQMKTRYSLDCAIAVNNVGNAFTPQGVCDPLSVANLGVGVYQSGTRQDTEILLDCISSYAKRAIGLKTSSLKMSEGHPADFVLFGPEDGKEPAPRTVPQLVYYPPSLAQRKVVYRGNVLPAPSTYST